MLKRFLYFILRIATLTILYTTLSLAAISAGVVLLVAYDPGDGWCYWEWRRLSKEEFCRRADDDLPIEKAQWRRDRRTSCVVSFRPSNTWYAEAQFSYSDPSICKDSSCIQIFDACGSKVRI